MGVTLVVFTDRYFGLLDHVASSLRRNEGRRDGGDSKPSAMASSGVLLAGTATRATAAVLMNPVQVVKTRMEMGKAMGVHYSTSLHAFAALVREEKARGLLKGVGPTILRDAPYVSLLPHACEIECHGNSS